MSDKLAMLYTALVEELKSDSNAGASGLAAARTLHDTRYNVLVLEARDRIGERVHTLIYATSSHFCDCLATAFALPWII